MGAAACGCGCAGTTAPRRPRAAAARSTAPRSSSSPTTSTRRARTPSRASASSTPSRTTPSSTTSGLRISTADSTTRRAAAHSPPTVSPCTVLFPLLFLTLGHVAISLYSVALLAMQCGIADLMVWFVCLGIASVRCHTTRMTSWCSVRDARTGKFLRKTPPFPQGCMFRVYVVVI
jgi:hypothetical protein